MRLECNPPGRSSAKPDTGSTTLIVLALAIMRSALKSLLIGLSVALPFAAAAKTQLTVYTASAPEEISRVGQAFAAANADIELRWVRDSTERILTRLRFERQQPKADVVWALAGSAMAELAAADYFQPYAPKGFERLERRFSDASNPPMWVGQRAWATVLCVNPAMLAAANLKRPTRWGDLLDPAFRGLILALDPAASRTGLMSVDGWFALWGDGGAWRYMEGLHRNVAAYMRAGNTPCDFVAQGRYPVGISYAYRAAKLQAKGRPVEGVLPGDGVGWDVEAMAIVRGTPYLDAARVFADWTVSDAAMDIQARGFGMMSLPTTRPLPRFYPEKIKQALVPTNFARLAVNRDRMLAEWRIRFGAKAEPGG